MNNSIKKQYSAPTFAVVRSLLAISLLIGSIPELAPSGSTSQLGGSITPD